MFASFVQKMIKKIVVRNKRFRKSDSVKVIQKKRFRKNDLEKRDMEQIHKRNNAINKERDLPFCTLIPRLKSQVLRDQK